MRSLTRMALAATGEAPAVPELKRPAELGTGAEDNCNRDTKKEGGDKGGFYFSISNIYTVLWNYCYP